VLDSLAPGRFLQGHRLPIGAGGRHSHHCQDEPRQRGIPLARVSPHGDRRRPDHVVVVFGRVEVQGIDLHLTDAVGGLGHDAVCAGLSRSRRHWQQGPNRHGRPTGASSSRPLMTTAATPTKAVSVSPSHSMCAARTARLQIALTQILCSRLASSHAVVPVEIFRRTRPIPEREDRLPPAMLYLGERNDHLISTLLGFPQIHLMRLAAIPATCKKPQRIDGHCCRF